MANIAPVGYAALGAGLWGQLDLAGEMWEWNLDHGGVPYAACTDCADFTTSSRVARGGSFFNNGSNASDLQPPTRNKSTPTIRTGNVGLRCARTP